MPICQSAALRTVFALRCVAVLRCSLQLQHKARRKLTFFVVSALLTLPCIIWLLICLQLKQQGQAPPPPAEEKKEEEEPSFKPFAGKGRSLKG
jgi:hypothetical protein